MVGNALKSLALVATISFGSGAFAQAATALKAAQTDGSALANSTTNVVPRDAKALVESGTQTGASNVMGSKYTGQAPTDLTGKVNAPSMFGAGDAARITSVNKVQGVYSNNYDKQADEGVYFLDKKPLKKQTLDPNDSILSPLHYNMNESPFASSQARTCTDQVNPAPNKDDFYSCLVTYNPYVYPCTIENKVSFHEEYTACPEAWVLQGNQCFLTTYTHYNANVSYYYCLGGAALSGTTCTSYSSANVSYSCPLGASLSGTSCISLTPATVSYSCPSGYTQIGSQCSKSTAAAATPTGILASSASGDMAVYTGDNGNGTFSLSFGTQGDNYWGHGVYDRSMTFNITNKSSLDLFVMDHVEMDDWLLVKVNGTTIYVAPHGGDRLDIVSREVCDTYEGENGQHTICYINPSVIQYGPNSFSTSWEFSKSWHFYPNIDIRPYLVEGSNTITTRTIVGGKGESYIHFNTRSYGCPPGQTLSGNLCLSSTSMSATPSYSCSSGTLVGTQCSSTGTAAVSYYCPSGAGTLVGAQCMTSTGAIPAYSCPSPDTLSGTTCTHATTSAIPQPTVTVMDESTLNNCSPAEQ